MIRWRHPEKGLMPPGEFIPVAEQTGLIVSIGAWVIRKACKDIAAKSDHLKVSVNVSAIEFRDSNVAAAVRDALSSSSMPPSRLKIEITESLLMTKDSGILQQLKEIRELGVHIAMDDFGTGFSSLSYLQSYPIDCIKIDRSFVSNIGKTKESTAIIAAIATLAKCLEMTTIAEGVETIEQLETLSNIGCDEVQGYLLSRPEPIDKVSDHPKTDITGTRAAA